MSADKRPPVIDRYGQYLFDFMRVIPMPRPESGPYDPLETREPHWGVIHMLEDVLERAKRGELQSILAVGWVPGTGFMSMKSMTHRANYYGHIGALEDLKADLQFRLWAENNLVGFAPPSRDPS